MADIVAPAENAAAPVDSGPKLRRFSVILEVTMGAIGIVTIILGYYGIRMIDDFRKKTRKTPDNALIRARIGAAFFMGFGVGILWSILMRFLKRFRTADIAFLYLYLALAAVVAGFGINRVTHIHTLAANNKDTTETVLETEVFLYATVGLASGVILNMFIDDVVGRVLRNTVSSVRAAAIVASLVLIAASSIDLFIYTHTEKVVKKDEVEKTGLGLSIAFVVIGSLLLIGVIASFFLLP